jgi:hypothetical protein
MSEDSPTPDDESSANFQLHQTLSDLERGDRINFGGGIDTHVVAMVESMKNIVLVYARPTTDATLPDGYNDLGDHLALEVAYSASNAGNVFNARRELLQVTRDPQPQHDHVLQGQTEHAIGTLSDATVRTPDDRDHRVCDLQWNALFDAPERYTEGSECFDDPNAVISDRADFDAAYLNDPAQQGGGPVAPNAFAVQLSNYGVAHLIPSSGDESIARLDITGVNGELETRLEDLLDTKTRKAFEQLGEVPLYILGGS